VRLNTEAHAAQPTVTSASTELALISAIPAIVPAEFFKSNGADAVLSALKEEVRKVAATLDISTPGGREAIASLAYKVARSKTALDEQGKELVGAIKKQSGEIDAERKRVRDELDALKDEVRKPLTDWENAEKERVAAHEAAIHLLEDEDQRSSIWETSTELKARIEVIERMFTGRDWQEFAKRAESAKIEATDSIYRALGIVQKREAEQKELERLRAEAAERAIKEREEAAAKAAKEAAERRAEEQARIAREAAERERQRIENERIEAEARAKQAEAERVAAAEKAERDRIAEAERTKQRLAEIESCAAAERTRLEQERIAEAEATRRREYEAQQKAERDQVAAVEAERQRVAAQKKADAEEAEKRAKNRAHRLKIGNEALGAIVALDIPMDRAQDLLIAIAKGAVPHVTISY
jgi:chromosome segregation ATPase